MVASILIIEDDEGVLTYLKEFLFEHGYNVMTATAGAKGLAIIKKTAPDLVILDLGLPDTSGETLCRQIREKFSDIQIIMLTAKDTPQDIIQGLKLGADDYLTKPFDAEVLLARIQARLRRKTGTNANLQVGDLKLDTQTMQVTRAKKELHLTAQEYKLLEYLMQNMGKVLTRDMILNRKKVPTTKATTADNPPTISISPTDLTIESRVTRHLKSPNNTKARAVAILA